MLNAMSEYYLKLPEEKIFATCDYCDGDIYDGEIYYDIDGDKIHEDCFVEYCRNIFSDCRKEADCYEVLCD